MASFLRVSKYKHVYCDPPKPADTFQSLRLSTVTGDQNYIKANGLYFAVGVQGGGGPFAVLPLDKPGRYDTAFPVVVGHSAACLDFDFNPFNDNIVASASEDQTVKVWDIPAGGLTENLTTPVVDLHGHGKKVTFLRFHPTANNILASASADLTVKLWDIEKGNMVSDLAGVHYDLIQDVVWDYYGSNYATSSKDKSVRICDARSASVASTIETAHEGSKCVKLSYLGTLDKLVSVGFSKQSSRQFKIWDPRDLSKELKKIDIDQASGAIMPFFDPDTLLLYLCGKGDGNIRYYELTNENPYCHDINSYRSSVSSKGVAMIPKRNLDIMKCETARILKLTTNSVEPLSFYVPRKSEAFQDDIFPDTFSGVPSHSADDWLNGSDQPPALKTLNPSGVSSGSKAPSPPKPVVRTSSNPLQADLEKKNAELQAKSDELEKKSAELETANARIKALEEKLNAMGVFM